jgi:hypothetical protein
MALPGQADDASSWADVDLPDTSLPDGFILTQVGADGGVTAIDPSEMCPDGAPPDAAKTVDAREALDARKGADATVVSDAPGAGDAADASQVPVPANACTAPTATGDLIFDEIMISTEAGSDDRGQWLEVRSTLPCSVDLIGLHASAPHGQTFRTLDVSTDVWLPAGGFFLIADTLDPTENNGLPGLVFAWVGSPADALHKTSDIVTLTQAGATLDTLTYPSKKRVEGVSMAFPMGCAPGLRADFANWLPSTNLWLTGLYGTPGAANTDVMCAVPPIPMCTVRDRRAVPESKRE